MESTNACQELAATCEDILAADPDISANDFLRALGDRVAGIDTGVEGILDLARGGSNEIWGKGFAADFDDGSKGQARHFAGVAAAVAIFGGRATDMITRVFLDDADTADGRLSDAAVEFATDLLDGDLPLTNASSWIQEHICESVPPDSAMRIEPAPRS
ncbi:MAG: hypothetical protein KF883_02525 [Thermomicrobiales bacterium]|nr:hypothetical protein [Thermomicrobiales bacterium]